MLSMYTYATPTVHTYFQMSICCAMNIKCFSTLAPSWYYCRPVLYLENYSVPKKTLWRNCVCKNVSAFKLIKFYANVALINFCVAVEEANLFPGGYKNGNFNQNADVNPSFAKSVHAYKDKNVTLLR